MTEQRVAVILKSRDIAATIEWYERIGFAVRGRFPETDTTWVELARDGLVIQFVSGDTPWPGPPCFTGCMYVHPASVAAVHEEVRDRVESLRGVEERPWGARELTLSDPDGYFVTFTEPLVTEPRR